MKSKTRAKRPPASSRKPPPSWHRAVIADYARLRSFPGVVSVAIGLKEVKRFLTRRLCVKIYVARKAEDLPASHHLPRYTSVLFPLKSGLYKARRVRTDVVQVEGIKPTADPATRLDPAPMGAQVGFAGGVLGFGTLGCWVRKTGLSQACFLTAGHVLSDAAGSVAVGQTVYQPQPAFPSPQFDPFIIGQTLQGFIGNDTPSGGYLDYAAVAVPAGARGSLNSSVNPCISSARPHLSVQRITTEHTAVRKCGAATDCTEAVFSAYHAEFTDPGTGKTYNCVLEFFSGSPDQKFADDGDSGSIVVSRSPGSENAVVGLLFAVSLPDKSRGYVIPFERLAALGFQVA
jgi:hypothetical protein